MPLNVTKGLTEIRSTAVETHAAGPPLRPVLNRRIALYGWIQVAALLIYSAASYGLAPVVPFGGKAEPREALWFRGLTGMDGTLDGPGLFARNATAVLACGVPLVVATGTFLSLLRLLARRRQELDSATPTVLFRWAVAFTLAAATAAPAMVQDFWLSAGWGRMVAGGQNPYHSDLTPVFAEGLPLDYFGQRMTYGPLWALISGAVMGLAGENGLVAGAIFKALLVSAWVGVLSLVRALLRDRSPWHQCVGLAVAGWLPLGVMQAVAEGHNDVVLVFFLLLWLYAIESARPWGGTVALAASVLVKYVTAPLVLLDIAHAWRSGGQTLGAVVRRTAVVAGGMVAVFGLFFRSPDFFEATASMANWHFFRPSDAVDEIGSRLGIKVWLLKVVVFAWFPATAAYSLVHYFRRPTGAGFRTAVLAVMAAIVFSGVGHVWPWFLLWILPLAALDPEGWLARWVLGFALAAPFALAVLCVLRANHSARYSDATLVWYGLALTWFTLVPRTWLPLDESATTLSATGRVDNFAVVATV